MQGHSLAAFSILGVWAAAFGVRGWRSATLLASARKVTVTQLVWTTSWAWQQIDGFTAQTRPVQWTWLPSADGRGWVDVSAARLSEWVRYRLDN